MNKQVKEEKKYSLYVLFKTDLAFHWDKDCARECENTAKRHRNASKQLRE
jgi:hypothetical protein